jgi:hypothetical protein
VRAKQRSHRHDGLHKQHRAQHRADLAGVEHLHAHAQVFRHLCDRARAGRMRQFLEAR